MVEQFPLKEKVDGSNPSGLTDSEMSKKYGTKIKELIENGCLAAKNALDHKVSSQDYTLGEASHQDIDYGQADPRLEIARKTYGDERSKGGKGPDKKD